MKSTTILALGTIFVLQSSYAKRPKPPVRAFDAPGAPTFISLDKEGQVNPPVDTVGNYLIGPVYKAAPERKAHKDVPKGKVRQFNIDSKTTKLLNPGIARKEFGKVNPKNFKTLIVETHEIDYSRKITVYIPAHTKRAALPRSWFVMTDRKENPTKLSLTSSTISLLRSVFLPWS